MASMNMNDGKLFEIAKTVMVPDFYLNRLQERGIDQPNRDLVEHFLTEGAELCIDPHPLFNSAYYTKNSEIKENPFYDFCKSTSAESVLIHPLFCFKFLETQTNFAKIAPIDIFLNYLSLARTSFLIPHPMFDAKWYSEKFNSLIQEDIDPLSHYLKTGYKIGLRPHPLFCSEWYIDYYKSDAEKNFSPLEYHVLNGIQHNNKPNPFSCLLERFELNHETDFFENPNFDEPFIHNLTLFTAKNYRTILRPDGNKLDIETLCEKFSKSYKISQFVKDIISSQTEGAKDHSHLESTHELPKTSMDTINTSRLSDHLDTNYGKNVERYVVAIMEWLSAVDKQTRSDERTKSINYIADAIRKKIALRGVTELPIVSIVIPVFNQLHYTLACIYSILDAEPDIEFEIVIADDVSTDETQDVIPNLGGPIRLSRSDKNSGFLLNCNRTVSEVKSPFILLLNNDTVVLPGWLSEMLKLFETYSNVGIVGSKLISADGSLQEAGGIMWSDGSAWNYGRSMNPRDPEFNYLKHSDYCSAASVLISKKVWDEIGGFDKRYIPAYCEDSDFFFEARKRGYQTVYQPNSEVIHHEGVSHGTDVSKGLKNYQVINQKNFIGKWQHTLNFECFPNGQDVFFARDGSASTKHVLIIDHYVPQYDKDAGSRTIYALIKTLVIAGLQVHFWPDNLFYDKKYTKELQQLGVEVYYGERYLNRFDDWISNFGNYLHYAILSRPHVAIKYVNSVRKFSRATIIYYGHDLHFFRMEEEFKTGLSDVSVEQINAMRDLEMDNWRLADSIYYPSKSECDYITQLIPSKSIHRLVPYAFPQIQSREVRFQRTITTKDQISIIFVGGFGHGPNVDAVKWFAGEILPTLMKIVPRVKLLVVGSNPPASITRLESEHVTVFGYVSDATLTFLYEKSDFCVIPLRWGGGVKGKVIEAAYNQIPILTTSFGAQGIQESAEAFKICDSSDDFIEAIVSLIDDLDARQSMAREGLRMVLNGYSYASMAQSIAYDIPELQKNLSLLQSQ